MNRAFEDPSEAMPLHESDPRVFFAAERTLLAWLRTGLTIITLGFVVARFGLFVRLLAMKTHAGHAPTPLLSGALGVAFVVVGALTILIAAVQHRRFVATLTGPDLPPAYSRSVSVALAIVVGTLGLVLAVYLAVSPS